ncbi:MAG: TonB-dependent receptor plug domain-containing protein [Flavobacteriales bacterium]
MQTKHFITLFFSFLGFLCQAQLVLIKDGDNNPIGQVGIVNAGDKTDFVLTNEKGEASLKSKWKAGDSFQILHSLYEEKGLTYSQLVNVDVLVLVEKEHFLQEIVVSSNLNNEHVKTQAERKIFITKRQIERLNPQTTADVLEQQAGVTVQKSQAGGGSPNIRGNEANRVLLMIDGIRMNNAIYRGGHLQNSLTIDPSILANSEILFGPSSVAYGSDAVGGVIHFRTRNPEYTKHPKLNYRTSFYSGNQGLINHLDIEYGTKKLFFLTSLTRSTYQDTRMGRWRMHGYDDWGKIFHYSENGVMKSNSKPYIQKKSGYSQTDILQKLVKPLTKHSKLIGNFQYSNSSNINRIDQLNDYKGDELKYKQWYYGPQKRLLGAITFEDLKSRTWSDHIELISSYQLVEESRHTHKTVDDFKVNREEMVEVYSLNANFRKADYHYGLEFIYNDVHSTASKYFPESDSTANFSATRYPTGLAHLSSYAAYVKKTHSFSEKWKGNAGIRLTNTQLKGRYVTDKESIKLPFEEFNQNNINFNWNTSLVYNPDEDTKLGMIVSTGFHAPNLDDMAKFYEKGRFVVVPNLNLKSEYVTNFELSFSRHWNNKHLLYADVFYSHIRNPIIKVGDFQAPEGYFVPDGLPMQSNVNMKAAYTYGMSVSMSSQLNKFWSSKVNLSLTQGKITALAPEYEGFQTTNLAHLPPLFGKWILEHKNNAFRQQFSLLFNARKNPSTYDQAGTDNLDETPVIVELDPDTGNKIDEHYQGTPAWFTLNYMAMLELNKSLSLQAGVSNILDVHYKTFGSGHSAMGRSLNLTLRAHF